MSSKPLLEWVSLPIRDYKETFLFLTLFFAIFTFGLWQLCVVTWKMPGLFYLGLLVIFLDLLPAYIPTRYRFHEDRIDVTHLFLTGTRKYSDFHCWYADKRGVMLGTFLKPNRLDRFRGQSVRYSKGQGEKDALFELLRSKIGEHC